MAKISKKQKSVLDVIFKISIATFLILYACLIILPLLWGGMTSLKSYKEVLGILPYEEANLFHLPQKFVWDNYKLVWDFFKAPIGNNKQFYAYFGTTLIKHEWDVNFFTILVNTIFYTVVGSLIQAVTPAVMGYMCARYKNKAAYIINAGVIVVMALPIIGNTSATIMLLRNLNLYDNWIGNFIQKFHFAGMYFLVFQAFFEGMTNSYAEAAEIDGASQWKIMTVIYMPLAVKMILTVCLILFVHCWNDYQTIYMYLPTKPTLAYIVYEFGVERTNFLGQPIRATHKIAACMTVAIPIIIIFICLQDKIMGNISMGGVKE